MTTNEPEVFTFNSLSEECVRLSDYERLQADHERLQAEREELRTALAESRANDLTAMGYLNQIRQLVGGDDFPDMVRRCEKLRKDAERYQSLLEAVLCEIPHREARRGNAPGHAHSVPGIWDEDNGALAGKECAWCKVWNEAVSAMQEANHENQ